MASLCAVPLSNASERLRLSLHPRTAPKPCWPWGLRLTPDLLTSRLQGRLHCGSLLFVNSLGRLTGTPKLQPTWPRHQKRQHDAGVRFMHAVFLARKASKFSQPKLCPLTSRLVSFSVWISTSMYRRNNIRLCPRTFHVTNLWTQDSSAASPEWAEIPSHGHFSVTSLSLTRPRHLICHCQINSKAEQNLSILSCCP